MSILENQNLHLLIGQNSDRGLDHEHNEDSYQVFQTTLLQEGEEIPAHVAMVADGIGGAVGGKKASRLAVHTIEDMMTDEYALKRPIPNLLNHAILQANQAIYEQATRDPQLRKMGTTILVAVMANQRLYVSHAGDSRAYLIRHNTIHQLTVDHSWVQEAIAAKRLTPEEAKIHPNRGVIKRYLGIHKNVEVDHRIIDIAISEKSNGQSATASSLELQAGDVVLLCSDGLSDFVSDQDIQKMVNKRRHPQKAVNQLIKSAKRNGGTDDITVVMLALTDDKMARFTWPIMQLPLIPLILLLLLLFGTGTFLWSRLGNAEVEPAAIASSASTPATNQESPYVEGTVITEGQVSPSDEPNVKIVLTTDLDFDFLDPTSTPVATPNSGTSKPTTVAIATSKLTTGTSGVLATVPSGAAQPALPQPTKITTSTPYFPPALTATPVPQPTVRPIASSTVAPTRVLQAPEPTSAPATSAPTTLPLSTFTSVPRTSAPATSAPPTSAPPTSAPPTSAPPTSAPPTSAPPTSAPPTSAPPTSAPPTSVPPTFTSVPPTFTSVPPSLTSVPPTSVPPTATPIPPTLTPVPPTATPIPPTPTPTRVVTMNLLSPGENEVTADNLVKLRVQIVGMLPGDRLELKMGTNANNLYPVALNWQFFDPRYEADLTRAPEGRGILYYWTVALVDANGVVVPPPKVHKLLWKNESDSKPGESTSGSPTFKNDNDNDEEDDDDDDDD